MEHDITDRVYAAKEDAQAADELVRQYLPFIKSETTRFLKRIPVEGQDDELGIAMFAFHEAAIAYSREKGAFLKLASIAIRNRLIDYQRKEKRHAGVISLDQTVDGDGESRTLLEQIDTGDNELSRRQDASDARKEIMEFAQQLSKYGLKLSDIADNCPRQERTLAACHRVLAHARENPMLLDILTTTGKLPIAALSAGSGVERKAMERHRKYLVALLLAFTNGFGSSGGTCVRCHSGKAGRTE